MEIDLERHEEQGEAFRAQVCVVGAGIAGITLAHALRRRGVEVALLEAGGQGLEERGQSLLAEARFSGQPHVGTREGRFRAFGGASLRWGGQLLRMPKDAGVEWPVGASELASYQAEAERLLGVDALPYAAEGFFAKTGVKRPSLFDQLGEVDVSLSKWTPFARRNLAQTMGLELLRDPRVTVYLHAQVTEVLLAPDGARVEAFLVRRSDGKSFRFEAEQFVVAAGTVETCRLLLASRSVTKEGVGNVHGQVGRGFHDHPTLPVATFTGASRERVVAEFRPWVFGDTVHSVKMEASAALRERMGLNPVLAHMTIEEPEGSGIAVVRELLTAVQRGEFVSAVRRRAGVLPRALMEVLRLGWEAKVRRRRFVSKDAVVKLYLNVAQDVPSLSSVGLGNAVDAFGMPQVVVDWHVSESELGTLRGYAEYLRQQFEAMGLTGVEWVPEVLGHGPALPGKGAASLGKGTSLLGKGAALLCIYDARHAMGGACIGDDPASSVVDAELKVHGVENLWVASAAVFPNGSPQLPTLPLMALTLRLAERLAPQ